MSYSIVPTPTFERSLKVLVKRYKSMKDDMKDFCLSLQENPLQGSDLGGGLRKVRMAIASKGKGSRGISAEKMKSMASASTVDVKIIQKQLIDLGLASD